MPTNFKSDNVTAACPEVMEALLRTNADEAANSYGGTTGGTPDEPDPSTLRMNELFAETFECEVEELVLNPGDRVSLSSTFINEAGASSYIALYRRGHEDQPGIGRQPVPRRRARYRPT